MKGKLKKIGRFIEVIEDSDTDYNRTYPLHPSQQNLFEDGKAVEFETIEQAHKQLCAEGETNFMVTYAKIIQSK